MVAKSVFKGTAAVAVGYLSQQQAFVPAAVSDLAPPEVEAYLNFVVGTFIGLVLADAATRDITPGKPVKGAVKGATGALGGAIPLILIEDVALFHEICAIPLAHEILTTGVGGGNCYPYLVLVTGTFIGVVAGDILIAPYSMYEKKKQQKRRNR
jgi:hypothetical protein